ncbi:hypothetical protein BC938DRAFT_477739, partial [Jimgerdemannia flammicorona]
LSHIPPYIAVLSFSRASVYVTNILELRPTVPLYIQPRLATFCLPFLFFSSPPQKKTPSNPIFRYTITMSQAQLDTLNNKATYYHAQLDKELSKHAWLNDVEAKTKVSKVYIVLGAGSLLFIAIFFNLAGDFLTDLIGWVYPVSGRIEWVHDELMGTCRQDGFNGR